jgi:hypothetical protein
MQSLSPNYAVIESTQLALQSMVKPSSVCTIEFAISTVRKQTTGDPQTLACEKRQHHTTELLRPSLASTGNSSQAPLSKT